MEGFFTGILMGTIAHEPKVYHSDDGKTTLYLSMLVTKSFDGKTFKQYVDVAVRGKAAQRYEDRLTKGMTIILSGDVQTKKREKEGVTFYTQFLSVFIDTLIVIEGPATQEDHDPRYPPSKPGGYDDDDNLPF